MEKNLISNLIKLNLSQREIAKRLNVSQTTIKYWLNRHNLKTNKLKFNKTNLNISEKLCNYCKQKLPINSFYRINRSKCKKCENIVTIKKQKQNKLKMLEYKGNKCFHCNLEVNNFNHCVFDFHHLNPHTKDRNYNSIKSWNWERIVKEIDDCIILCANCHRIEHHVK